MGMELVEFSSVNLQDHFFDSLRQDYSEFDSWFRSKKGQNAYIHSNDSGLIDGFLYLKIENGDIKDTIPVLPSKKRVKIGTLKIDAHGTRLGERFIKKALDYALFEHADEIYLTIFSKHESLIELITEYGFLKIAEKRSNNGIESVFLKKLPGTYDDIIRNYPFVTTKNKSIYALSIYPKWHSRLLPDSILRTENEKEIIEDTSHTNSIHKIYLTSIRGTELLKRGDVLLIYRTSDNQGPAYYRSVITSVCVIEEVRSITEFTDFSSYFDYCGSYSIFSKDELDNYFATKEYKTIIKFTYNYALPKRITRGQLMEDIGISPRYWGFFPLSKSNFLEILSRGKANESLVVD
jgi:hypothetical protein